MKNFKKSILLTLSMGLITIPMASSVYATNGQNDTGNLVMADTTGGSGANLTTDLSPGVTMSWATFQNAFALSATNANAQSAYRMEYAVYSAVTGYYQTPNNNAPDATTGAVATEWTASGTWTGTTDPFAALNWPYMGNAQ